MNLFSMAKQMKDLQGQVKKARETLAVQTVTGTSRHKGVSIELSGTMEVRTVRVDPRLAEAKDTAGLERQIGEALADALVRAQKLAASQLMPF